MVLYGDGGGSVNLTMTLPKHCVVNRGVVRISSHIVLEISTTFQIPDLVPPLHLHSQLTLLPPLLLHSTQQLIPNSTYIHHSPISTYLAYSQ